MPASGRPSAEGVIYVLTSPSLKNLDYDKANKLVPSSKKLSRVFSLSQYHAKSIYSLNQKEHGHDGPEPLIWETVLHRAQNKEVPVPLIHYKELAAEILGFWVSAISETAAIAEVDGLPKDIDLEMCYALFNHYCADGEQNEPGKQDYLLPRFWFVFRINSSNASAAILQLRPTRKPRSLPEFSRV